MPTDPTRVEITTGRERRRRYTAEQKLRLVEETMQPGMSVSAVAPPARRLPESAVRVAEAA